MAPFRRPNINKNQPESATEHTPLNNPTNAAEESDSSNTTTTTSAEGGESNGGGGANFKQDHATLQDQSITKQRSRNHRRRLPRKAKSKALQRMTNYHFFCSFCSDREGADGSPGPDHRYRRQQRKVRRGRGIR